MLDEIKLNFVGRSARASSRSRTDQALDRYFGERLAAVTILPTGPELVGWILDLRDSPAPAAELARKQLLTAEGLALLPDQARINIRHAKGRYLEYYTGLFRLFDAKVGHAAWQLLIGEDTACNLAMLRFVRSVYEKAIVYWPISPNGILTINGRVTVRCSSVRLSELDLDQDGWCFQFKQHIELRTIGFTTRYDPGKGTFELVGLTGQTSLTDILAMIDYAIAGWPEDVNDQRLMILYVKPS